MTEFAARSPIFFLPGGWLVFQIDPFAVLGLRNEAGAEEIAGCLAERVEPGADPREELARALLASPERLLAWYLLGAESYSLARPGSQPMRFQSPLAMSTARGLLFQALAHEGAGELQAAEALWPRVDQAWLALAGDAQVRQLMVSWVRELGLVDPEAVADAVREAIAAELLPWLHACMAVGTDEEHHGVHRNLCRGVARAAHRRPAALLRWAARRELAASLRYRGRGSGPVVEACLEALEVSRPERGSALASELGGWCWELVDTGDALSADLARRVADRLEAAAKQLPDDLDLRVALAKVWLCLAMAILRERHEFVEVLHLLNRASVLDPTNPAVRPHWEVIYEMLVEGCSRLRELPPEELTDRGREYLWLAENAPLLADCFPESPEGRALAEERARASEGQAARRLGLPVPSGLEVVRLLVASLASWDKQDASFEGLRSRCVEGEPRLAKADWTLLKALALAGPITAFSLARQLSPPAPEEGVPPRSRRLAPAGNGSDSTD